MTVPAGPTAPDDGAASAAVPRCYRHSDRETYVRCSRCDRPICPDCMLSAAVGFQCPECVAAGNRKVRTPRTALGGRVSRDVGRVTLLLIGLNVAVFLVELASASLHARIESRFAMLPGLPGLGGVADGQYYRLLTAAFLHDGVLHIGLNMYVLYVVGPTLEGILGRGRFLALYLVAALGGSTLSYLTAPISQGSVGASGAIFGLFGALLIVSRRLDYDIRPIAIFVGLNLLITFVVPNIDWRGHIGGLVTGLVLGAAFGYAPKAARVLVGAAAPLAVFVVLAVAVAARTASLTG